MANPQLDPQRMAVALGGKAYGNQIQAPAPGHSKQDLSLSIQVRSHLPEGFVVNAHAGEDPIEMRDYVRQACGLPEWTPDTKAQPAQIYTGLVAKAKAKSNPKPYSDIDLSRDGFQNTATYDYTSPDGEVLFQVLRYEHPTRKKTFRQRQPDGRGGWNLGRPDPVVYRWHEIDRNPGLPVYIVEGEKDADNLALEGLLATTAPNGSWPDDLSPLKGRKVFVIPDNDRTGSDKADKIIAKLEGIATVKRVDLPGLPEKGDATDWLAAGNTIAALQELSQKAAPVAANQNSPSWPGLIASGDFVRGFVPPDYHIDGIVQAGFVYSVTASSGTGKTAILLLITALTALGEPLGDREVRKGRAIYFAGENPNDVTMRWIAQAHHMGFDAEEIDVYFVPGVFDIKGMFAEVAKGVEALGGADLIIVDTSAAYFMGQDENGNVDMGKHARDLRGLTTVTGSPCVLVACHPTKGATQENLLPRGGGAFIAEMDGNLTCAKVADGTVKLHWQGKHRGPDFDPVMFDLSTVTAPALKDSRGRDAPTVMASVMSDGEVRAKKQAARNDEDEAILRLEQGAKSASQVAEAAGWRGSDGKAHKRRAQSVLNKLRSSKLAVLERKGWKLTKVGEEAAVDVRTDRHWAAVGTAVAAKLIGSN
jgi:hypothetical protein